MLSLQETALIERLERKLRICARNNEIKYKYYYGHLIVKDLGVSTPPRLRGLNSALGWGTSAVDVLEERLLFRGFYSPNQDVEPLNELYRENFLEVMQRPATKDALITGTSYISVAPGDTDISEAPILFRPESPDTMTGDYNFRTLEMNNAFKAVRVGDQIRGTLWTPDATIGLVRDVKSGSGWYEVDRDEHNLGFVSVATIINEQDSHYPRGRSEISRALRGHIDTGMRTLLGTEVAREFFALPLRAMVGADASDFVGADGQPLNAWDLIAGKIINMPYNSNAGILPQILQLPASNPENIMNLLEPMARLAAREIGVPPSFFGFETVNPTSADAINEADKKILHKANKRIPELGLRWKQAYKYAQIMQYGEVMPDWVNVEAVFMRPETPTPQAAADRITKLISSGVFERLYPDFVYREIGLREVEILQLKQFIQSQGSQDLISQLLKQNGDMGIAA